LTRKTKIISCFPNFFSLVLVPFFHGSSQLFHSFCSIIQERVERNAGISIVKTILLTYCATFLTIESSMYDGRAGTSSLFIIACFWFLLAEKGRGFTVRQSRRL